MSASAGCGGADQAQAAARSLPGSFVPDGEHTLCVVDTYAQAVVPLRLKADAVETSVKRPHDESEELRDQYRIVRMLCADVCVCSAGTVRTTRTSAAPTTLTWQC
jgi:hypothetical protein